MGLDGSISPAPGVKMKGGDAVSIRVRLDDGTNAEVAGSGSTREVLSGPFVALHEKTTEAPTA